MPARNRGVARNLVGFRMVDHTSPGHCAAARHGRSGQRARICSALEHYLAEKSQAEIASILGVAATTVGRRGPEISMWPAPDLLALAIEDTAIADALRAFLDGEEEPTGEAIRVHGELVQEIADSSQLHIKIANAIGDGRVTPAEARELLAALEQRANHEAVLRRDLMALMNRISA